MTLIQKLRNNPEETAERARKLQEELSGILNSRADEIESGRSTTPSTKIIVGWKWREFTDETRPLLYIGLGEELLQGDIDSIKLQDHYDLEKGLRRLKVNKEARKRFKGVGGSYDGNVLQMKKMRKDDLKTLRQEFPEFEPLFNHLYTDEITSTLSHELTHAYIRKNTAENSGDRPNKIRVIDEASAQLTGTILGSNASDPHDYQYDRSELHTAEQLLDGRINHLDSPDEKIDTLRKTATEAIRSIQRNPSFDLIQAIDSDKLNRAKNFRMTAFFLERAEREAGDALNILGLIDHDFTQSLTKIEDEVELEYRQSVKSVFPKDLPEPVDDLLEDEAGMNLDMDMESVGLDDDTLEDELADLESPELDFNETMNTIEAATSELEEIIREDGSLNQEEKDELERTVRKLENMLKVFQEKRDSIKGKLEQESLRFRVGQITSQQLINSEKAINQLQNIIKSYRKIIDAGQKLCKAGIKALSSVHDEEERSAQLMERYSERAEYEQIEKTRKYTEGSYRILKECRDVLSDSDENMKMAMKRMERMKEAR